MSKKKKRRKEKATRNTPIKDLVCPKGGCYEPLAMIKGEGFCPRHGSVPDEKLRRLGLLQN